VSAWRSLVLVFAAVIGFIIAAALAASHERFEGDLWLTGRVQEIDSSAFSHILDWTEDVGDDPIVIAIWVAAGGVFYFLGGWTPPVLFALAGAGRMINPLLKDLIERPRPSADLVDVSEFPDSFSYPSGHAASAIVLFGLIFYFTQVYVKPLVPRLVLQVSCTWMIVGVGIERVYVGAHWPSDVIAGFWFGGLVVAANVMLHRYLTRRRSGTMNA
jgi:undecaprenyl-diphosphatase